MCDDIIIFIMLPTSVAMDLIFLHQEHVQLLVYNKHSYSCNNRVFNTLDA